jgi:acetylornithine/succinyldiaminopimelate/putrescine aminotransferase
VKIHWRCVLLLRPTRVLQQEGAGDALASWEANFASNCGQHLPPYEMVKEVRGEGMLAGIEFLPPSNLSMRSAGVQPPLVNRDGRDLGPEAIQMLEAHSQEELPFPGGLPSASATAMPIPQTIEEANRQVQQAYASPTP